MKKDKIIEKIHNQESRRQNKRTNKLKEKFGNYSTPIYFTKKSEDILNKLLANHPHTKNENKKEKYCIIINELIQRLYIETHFSGTLTKNNIAQKTYQSYTLISNYLYIGKDVLYIKNKLEKKKLTPPEPYKEWDEECILKMSSMKYIIDELKKLK